MLKKLLLLICMMAVTSAFAQEASSSPVSNDQDAAIHQELKGVLQGIQKAINDENYEGLTPYFDDKMRVTTINQEILSSHADIKPYFNRWFGPGKYLSKLRMNLVADDTTELYDNKTFGIVRGSGTENYTLADGRQYDMQTRWTATVHKSSDGKWRILALHIGTNFLDNPLLNETEKAVRNYTIGGTLGGLLIGFLLGWILKRRKVR